MKERVQKVTQSLAWRTMRLTHARWAAEDGDQRAAAFAYYLLLSILPLVLLLVAAGSFFFEREAATEGVVNLLNQYTPLSAEQEAEAVATIHEWLNSRSAISLTAFPLLIWGAMKYLSTLVRTTNRIWRAPNYNWWRLPIKSLGLLGITASAFFIGILLPTLANLVREWTVPHLQFPAWAFALIFRLIPVIVLFYALIMIYRLAPRRPTHFSEVWQGALAVTFLIWLGERLFLIYATNLAQFNALYGALGGMLALLLWLYLSSCFGVFGICLCAAQAEIRGENDVEPPPL